MNRPLFKPAARVLHNLPEGAKPLRAIPKDFPHPDLARNGNAPAAVYEYRNADGSRACLVTRIETPRGKLIRPLSVWEQPNGRMEWYAKALPDDRPPYGLHDMLRHPQKVVLISEGEKCAEAAAKFSDFVSISWMGGCKALGKTDFRPLAGRNVIILPDNDAPGEQAAEDLALLLDDVGAASIQRLNIVELAKVCKMEPEVGFDIADAIEQGLDAARFEELLATPEMLRSEATIPPVFEDTPESEPGDQIQREVKERFGITPDDIPGIFSLSADGVVKHSSDSRGNPVDIYSGSPLVVLGRTRSDRSGQGWGYLVALRTPAEEWVTLAIPARVLAGDGRELRELLADAGAILPQDKAGRQGQAEFIGYAQHGPIVEVATRPGWHGNRFALPQGILRPKDAEDDLLLDMNGRQHFLAQAGTMEGWRELARHAEGNSRACFAISVALAAPLLRLLNLSGGGFHLFGQSSRGKTTLLTLAGSVWGGGGGDGFVRNWRMTDNGAEGMLSDHNDLLFPLDEMTAATPEMVSALNYLFANGHGKSRAARDGSARMTLQSRVLVLSSGEHAAAQQIGFNRGRTRMTGGLAVRMLDIPIEHAPGESFETLSEFENPGQLADFMSVQAKTHYGHAGPAFVQTIMDRRDEVISEAERVIQAMLDGLIDHDDDPQVRRVAARFGLVGAAAALASKAGVVPWDQCAGIKASGECFRAWKAWRGGGGSQEEADALAHLKAFFETHGRVRFERIVGDHDRYPDKVLCRTGDFPARERCGYFEEREENGPIFYVLPEAFKREICGEHNPDLMIRIAEKHGALVPDRDGHKQKKKRLPDYPNGKRVYVLQPDLLP